MTVKVQSERVGKHEVHLLNSTNGRAVLVGKVSRVATGVVVREISRVTTELRGRWAIATMERKLRHGPQCSALWLSSLSFFLQGDLTLRQPINDAECLRVRARVARGLETSNGPLQRWVALLNVACILKSLLFEVGSSYRSGVGR